jgi:hypothetical protein
MHGPKDRRFAVAFVSAGISLCLGATVLLVGCGQTAPYFAPQTTAGAQCAVECDRDRKSCHRTPESSADCERIHAQCIAGCKQLEREITVN